MSKSNRKNQGVALIIVLAFVVLLTGLSLAYFSHTATDRQLARASFHDTSAELLAHRALNMVPTSLKREIITAGPNVTQGNIQPQRSGDNASIPNLIRRSLRDDGIPPPGVPSLASTISSGAVDPANPRRGEVTRAHWNTHYLIPSAASFTPPDWVLVTRHGPDLVPLPSEVIGRYAFAVYDEGGLLDMNLAGFPTWSGSSDDSPVPTPTPWQVNFGRKGIVAFADLTAFPAPTPTSSEIRRIVGWRNYGTTKQTATSFGRFSFQLSPNLQQDAWGSYLLDFGDAPYADPAIYPFTSVPSDFGSNSRTDQALMSRRELLRLQSTIRFSQDHLQYMGTFSRERNHPAPDWRSLNDRLPDRFPMNAIGLVKPGPPDSVTTRGRGNGDGNGAGDANEWDPTTGNHTTIIEYNGGFVLGWENENNPSSPGYDFDKDPYAWIIDPNTGSTKPRPAAVPMVINHPLSNVGEFGYGLDTANGFQPLSFVTETSNDKAVLDFFTYNPVLHSYPRAGIFNLNTGNAPVLAAALKGALKNDTLLPPPSSGIISASEAAAAAQRIVDETRLRPVLNRGDVARLVRVGANASWTKEQKEAIGRALAEMGQARTWNLFIDVIAQTGKCAPGETDLTSFVVEGEKRYWLHIALGRDPIGICPSCTVDVLGSQLEEVIE